MFKEIVLPILGVIVFIALVGIFVQKSPNIKLPGITPVQNSQTNSTDGKSVTINGQEIVIEVADTKEERAIGLSDKTSLVEDSGMLFVFDSKDVNPLFWMKDMQIAIDIIWINDDKIVKIDQDIQPPEKDTPDSKLEVYSAEDNVDYVLEVPAGYSQSHNFKVGDSVDLSHI